MFEKWREKGEGERQVDLIEMRKWNFLSDTSFFRARLVLFFTV